jgi:Ran-binding protein 3
MRADATHRLILNAKVFPKMHFELVENKYVRFSVFLGDALRTYLAKVRSLPFCPARLKGMVRAVRQPVDGQAAAGGAGGLCRCDQRGARRGRR